MASSSTLHWSISKECKQSSPCSLHGSYEHSGAQNAPSGYSDSMKISDDEQFASRHISSIVAPGGAGGGGGGGIRGISIIGRKGLSEELESS